LEPDVSIRVIAFGAHPDDCEICAGGTAIKFVRLGHAVKFVSVTNGDAGHQSQGGGILAGRRRAESLEAGRRLGVEYEVLDNHDGELEPALHVREQVIRSIRRWNADIVMGPRPNDYHPDHRYTGLVVQDAAYTVMVPNLCPDTPALPRNPLFLYFEDRFQRPNPFRADIVIGIEDVLEQKIFALDAHSSQFYEWLPWLDGILDQVPQDPDARRKWLAAWTRQVLPRRGAEAFEICEYGRQPARAEIRELFPMMGE
jgi:LmbE family N-acetylglucosaminyl deacetylase